MCKKSAKSSAFISIVLIVFLLNGTMTGLSSQFINNKITPSRTSYIIQAGNASVEGHVYDWFTYEPIENVTVTAFCVGSHSSKSELTNSLGYFFIGQLSAGYYEVSAYKDGYSADKTIDFALSDNTHIKGDFVTFNMYQDLNDGGGVQVGVHDINDTKIIGAKVTLSDNSYDQYLMTRNSSYVFFAAVPLGKYTLTVYKTGFDLWSDNISVSERNSVTHVSATLTLPTHSPKPENKTAATTASPSQLILLLLGIALLVIFVAIIVVVMKRKQKENWDDDFEDDELEKNKKTRHENEEENEGKTLN